MNIMNLLHTYIEYLGSHANFDSMKFCAFLQTQLLQQAELRAYDIAVGLILSDSALQYLAVQASVPDQLDVQELTELIRAAQPRLGLSSMQFESGECTHYLFALSGVDNYWMYIQSKHILEDKTKQELESIAKIISAQCFMQNEREEGLFKIIHDLELLVKQEGVDVIPQVIKTINEHTQSDVCVLATKDGQAQEEIVCAWPMEALFDAQVDSLSGEQWYQSLIDRLRADKKEENRQKQRTSYRYLELGKVFSIQGQRRDLKSWSAVTAISEALEDTAFMIIMGHTQQKRISLNEIRFVEMALASITAVYEREHFMQKQHKATLELEAAAEQLQDQQQQVLNIQKMEAIGQLSAGIAHEINTPIQFIGDNLSFLKESFQDVFDGIYNISTLVNGAETLHKDSLEKIEECIEKADLEYLGDEVPQAIQQSIEGVTRVAGIIKSLKEFSHPGQNDKDMEDINAAIQSTLIVASNEYKYCAEVQCELEEGLPFVPCDIGLIKQVFLNLIVNAAHAIEAQVKKKVYTRGIITIRTASTSQAICIEVSDTGCGMEENVVRRIFEPFFTTKPVGKGTGQGMTIIHNAIVKKHSGHIDVQSKPGEGTTIRISLPDAEALEIMQNLGVTEDAL